MSVIFFSDVHLGSGNREEETAKEDVLLSFLKSKMEGTTALFIAGDLFDFWFEYKTVIPKGFHRTLSAIHEYTSRGIPVHYLTGNHDFWMRDFFATELGCEVHREPFEMTIQGKRVFLHHGDGLAKNDLGYRMIKPVLRNRFNIWLYRWLHPDLGVPLARGSSKSSREYTSEKHYEESGLTEFATARINEGTDIVIMGHQHKPSQTHINKGTYINLGDWITYHTYAELENGVIALKTWEHTSAKPMKESRS